MGIDPEKTIIEKDTCNTMFIAVLFTIGRTWKQLRCPPTDEMDKEAAVHVYNGIFVVVVVVVVVIQLLSHV